MIEHIVMIRWKDGVQPEQKEALLVEAGALNQIEGVVDVVARRDLGRANPERSKGITDVLVMTMDDEATLEHYSPHPIHRAFGAKLMVLVEDITIVDLPAWSRR